MTITVRPATRDDFTAITALLEELGRPPVADGVADHRAAFDRYLARPDTSALVAEDGGRVVGFLDLEFRQRLNVLAPQAWIPDLIVTDAARSRGVGAALLQAALELARGRGCFGLQLESANWRTRAHAFYEREGLAATALSFSIGLGTTPWPPAPRP